MAARATRRWRSNSWSGSVPRNGARSPQVPSWLGDHHHFGDKSNRVGFLGTLGALVRETNPVRLVVLEFQFHGATLDEMIAALAES